MSKVVAGNVFLGLSILMASVSQILLKALLAGLAQDAGMMGTAKHLLAGPRFWRTGLAGVLVAGGFACWLMCLSRLDLSYAYPIACGSALLVALMSVVFLGEPVTIKVWIGTLLIMAGTLVLAPVK
jgi:transporter family protein